MTSTPLHSAVPRSLLARCFGPGRFYLLRLVALWVAATAVTLLTWLALTWWLNHEPTKAVAVVTSGEVFNNLLVGLTVLVGLPMWHAAAYRWWWHRAGRPGLMAQPVRDEPAFGSEPTAPLPAADKLRRTRGQRLAYLAVYALGMPLLLWVYGPLDHQRALAMFLARHSAGSASMASLLQLLLVWLPMGLLLIAVLAVIRREVAAIQAGQLDPADVLRLRLKHTWLVAFVMAFAVVSVLCLFVGRATLRYLG